MSKKATFLENIKRDSLHCCRVFSRYRWINKPENVASTYASFWGKRSHQAAKIWAKIVTVAAIKRRVQKNRRRKNKDLIKTSSVGGRRRKSDLQHWTIRTMAKRPPGLHSSQRNSRRGPRKKERKDLSNPFNISDTHKCFVRMIHSKAWENHVRRCNTPKWELPSIPPTSSKNPPQREKTETETKLASKRTNAQGENGKVEIKVLPKLHTVYHAEKGSSLSLTTGLESILWK